MFKKKRRYKRRKKNIIKSLLGLLIPRWSLSAEAVRGVLVVFFLIFGLVSLLGFIGRAGELGDILNIYLNTIFGDGKWAIPFLMFASIFSVARDSENEFDSANVFGIIVFLISLTSLLFIWRGDIGGGVLGSMVVPFLSAYIGNLVTIIISVLLILVSLILIFDTTLSKIIGRESILFKTLMIIIGIVFYPVIILFKSREDGDARNDMTEDDEEGVIKEYEIEDEDDDEEYDEEDEDEEEDDIEDVQENDEKGFSRRFTPQNDKRVFSWKKTNLKIRIPFDLLQSVSKKPTSGNIDKNQEIIKSTLNDFGIPISMGNVTVGPTVTQYTFKPANGVSVSRVKALSDDLALNLAIHPVRIEAPIPGKPFVGLEVPNKTKVLVGLKEILKSKIFTNRKSSTMIPMGRDVSGKVWTDDLVKMPHILIAGATASGKSVFLHSIIASLLFQNNPDDLKFVMIDQKQVELSMYNDIPYLMAPVITEDKRAIRALQWCVEEMDRRLTIINEARCQNIADYNKKKSRDSMPYLVVVVDELGDLLSTAKKEAEGAIIRLGQKARASGIHLVLATQRPSVDILSGLIKANMPARAAFNVTSSINSKTILEHTGAEKLLGHGDMLYVNSSMSKPVRIQGAFISKEEIKEIVKYIKRKSGKADYELEFEGKGQSDFNFGGEEEEGDVMMEEARKMIIESGKASATMLQSRLGIGYPRANRILDNLEKQGVVGPSIQNKPRDVFVE